jgi:hypothetical protein
MVLFHPDLLFQNGFFYNMASRMMNYNNHEQNKEENGDATAPVVGYIEKEVMAIYKLLGWCWDEAMHHTVSKTSASHSCFGRGSPAHGWA